MLRLLNAGLSLTAAEAENGVKMLHEAGWFGVTVQGFIDYAVRWRGASPAEGQGVVPTADAAARLYNLATRGGNKGIERAEFRLDDGGRVIVLGPGASADDDAQYLDDDA